MFVAVADIEIWPSDDGRLSLPAETQSMLFRFGNGSDEFSIGAIASDASGLRFEAGTRHSDVTLTFWVEEAKRLVNSGDEFVVWHARDIGNGRVTRAGA